MANWISSKLRVAESFLQQIDQQAAGKLGKPEDASGDAQAGAADEIHNRADPSPSIKFQIPRKSTPPPSQTLDSGPPTPKPSSPPVGSRTPTPAPAPAVDGDWTELLGSAAPPLPSSVGRSGKTGPTVVASRSGKRGVTGRDKSSRKGGGEAGKKEDVKEKGSSLSKIGRRSSSLLDLTKELFSQELKAGSGEEKAIPVVSSNEISGKVLEDSKVVDVGISGGDESASKVSGVNKDSGVVVGKSASRGSSSSESEEGSDSGSDSSSASDSEEERRRREERRKKREKIRAERRAAIAAKAIRDREDMVARLEGEKLSLEKILEERQKKQAEEASELQSNMIETMEAVDIEKEKHNSTRMEAHFRLAELEAKNAELATSLAKTQGYLELEVNRVAELRQQIEMKEHTHEAYRGKISKFHQSVPSLDQVESLKKSQLEQEMLDAEYTFICDKITKLKDKAKLTQENIDRAKRETVYPSDVEIELKKRLDQLTDRLIQKQTQVEALSSEKAMLVLRIETVSRILAENGVSPQSADFADSSILAGSSERIDIEAGISQLPLKPEIRRRIKSSQQQLGSILQQLDSIFHAGIIFLKRNPKAQVWSLLYLLCLHIWVLYILMSKHQVSPDARSGAVYSLDAINRTAG